MNNKKVKDKKEKEGQKEGEGFLKGRRRRGPVRGPAVWLAGSLKEIHGAVEKGREKEGEADWSSRGEWVRRVRAVGDGEGGKGDGG